MSYIQKKHLFVMWKGKVPTFCFLICLEISVYVFIFLIYSQIKYNRLFKKTDKKIISLLNSTSFQVNSY